MFAREHSVVGKNGILLLEVQKSGFCWVRDSCLACFVLVLDLSGRKRSRSLGNIETWWRNINNTFVSGSDRLETSDFDIRGQQLLFTSRKVHTTSALAAISTQSLLYLLCTFLFYNRRLYGKCLRIFCRRFSGSAVHSRAAVHTSKELNVRHKEIRKNMYTDRRENCIGTRLEARP